MEDHKDEEFKFILNYQDSQTKFSVLKPLHTKVCVVVYISNENLLGDILSKN